MSTYTFNNVNYQYTIGSGVANVNTSPSASGNISLLSSFIVNSVTYNVTSIGNGAFFNNSLTGITIPNSITSIGEDAFFGCSGITSLTIPSSVTTIGPFAFLQTGITSLTIPSTVTTIGDSAFSQCLSLTNIVVNAFINNLNNVFNGLNNDNMSITFNYAGAIPSDGFQKSKLATLIIGPNITSIGGQAFWGCERLTSLTIPSSVTSIGGSAFLNCSGLTTLNIPSSVTSIGNSAFQNCTGLTNIILNRYYTNLNSVFGVQAGRLSSTVDRYVTFDYVGAVPEGFNNNSYLKGVTITNKITSINSYAFYQSTGLTSVSIGNSVTSIDENAFQNCSALTTITIPSSVTFIGNNSFLGCSSLLSVVFNGNIPSIGTNNFSISGDTAYYFLGASNLSRLSMFTSTKTIPLAPTITSVNGLRINFTQTPSDSSITNYHYSIDGTTYTELSPAQTTSPITIPSTGLKFLSTYTYSIKAFNGITSNASNGITTKIVNVIPCFKDDTKILTDKGYVEIKDLRKGDLVETFTHGLKPITVIAKKIVDHQASVERNPDQLYKYTKSTHNLLFEDLVITGRHAILVDDFITDEQRDRVSKFYNGFAKTDNKFLLPCCLDDNATVYETVGQYTVYHLALQNDDETMNYGIYANGLLAETASESYLKNRSRMELIE